MARQVSIRCDVCERRFGGQETWRKHRRFAGDQDRCYTEREMYDRGWYLDRDLVWHRPVSGSVTASSAQLRPSLFDAEAPVVTRTEPRKLARSTDPTTSQVAARRVSTVSIKARLIAAYMHSPEGLTDEEAAALLGIELYSATKRCADLRNEGLIRVVGERPGRSGLMRSVCRVAEQVSA